MNDNDLKLTAINALLSKPGLSVVKGRCYDSDINYLLNQLNKLYGIEELNFKERQELESLRELKVRVTRLIFNSGIDWQAV